MSCWRVARRSGVWDPGKLGRTPLEGSAGLKPALDAPATPKVRIELNRTQRRTAESRSPTGAPPKGNAPAVPRFSLADCAIGTFIVVNLAGDPGQRLSRVQKK